MRKLIYFATTFSVCHIFGLGNIWLGFTSAFLLLSLKFHDEYLWEIPLAVLSCSVLIVAFSDDIKFVVQILILLSAVPVALATPKKLLIFFPVSALALFMENDYSIALVWATLWYGVRSVFSHFIIKKEPLQEYKF